MSKQTEIKWRPSPQKQDYIGAQSYLSLQFEPEGAKKIVQTLKVAEKTEFSAKDIFRASELRGKDGGLPMNAPSVDAAGNVYFSTYLGGSSASANTANRSADSGGV